MTTDALLAAYDEQLRTDAEMARWLDDAGLDTPKVTALPPARKDGLTVKIWTAQRAAQGQRNAA